jgi:nucleolar complex protein 2
MEDLKALALKDPEFYKYLQENDAELLGFDGEAAVESEGEMSEDLDDDEDDEDSEDEEESKGKKGKGKELRPRKATPVLTKEIIKTWQKSILEVSPNVPRERRTLTSCPPQTRSIRSLKKLLLAFRSAASSGNDKEDGERWEIQSATVFNKLIVTTLKYTPVVLAQHVPFKEVAGK